MPDYDQSNVFAKILRGELPCHRVYEDEHTLAFMDVMPRAGGHVLVIPKAPSRNLLDIAPETLAALMRTVQTVARAAMKAMDASGITLQQFNETDGGQVVFHTHVHILPRWAGVKLKPPTGEMAKPDVLAEHAERIKAALGGAA